MLRDRDHIVLTGLKIPCIIGIFDWERKRKQDVLIDMEFPCDARKAARKDDIADAVDYKKVAKTTISFVEKSGFQLVETLAEELAALLIRTCGLTEIELSVSKPAAIRGSQNVGIRIHRIASGGSFPSSVFLSLGSNIQPRKNLDFALREISDKYPLVGLSHVYETSPVGYTKQASFWNMAAAIETNEKPGSIRKWLGALEKKAGRAKQRKTFGPRTLDVDLVVWKDLVGRSGGHALPHPDIEKKAFVLFPLLEIDPNFVHPRTGKTLVEIAAKFADTTQTIERLPANTFPDFTPQAIRR